MRISLPAAIASLRRRFFGTTNLTRATNNQTGEREARRCPQYSYLSRYLFPHLLVARSDLDPSEIPTTHWSPCNEATRSRFKATMRCSNGHLLTLRGHVIDEDGTVFPSVVCSHPRCSFHAIVRLEGWTFGFLDSAAEGATQWRTANTPHQSATK